MRVRREFAGDGSSRMVEIAERIEREAEAEITKKKEEGWWSSPALKFIVDTENGWCYTSCSKCYRKLQRVFPSFTCATQEADFLCKALVVGVNQENGWFLVELVVDDGKDSATFVVFDKEMTKLTGKEAVVLALDDDPNGEVDELPRCLEELAGKEFVFQIRVMPFNFTPNHRTFTVSTITEYNTLETCGKEHDDNILPNREAEVTLAASSSGQSVLVNMTGVEYAEANPPEVEGAQKKRKLSSE
ncbi:hypothetical protein F2Q69_00040501 [Brassica cretica]|uniref:Replication factor A C-terminal domain-containing protein n=1 Tax=Brassica cretica TaxID=69181 RepID=A0A8S9NQ77_BRACR|nr:hypothetical protein F2Q69_00040501 [Brassica cretica]